MLLYWLFKKNKENVHTQFHIFLKMIVPTLGYSAQINIPTSSALTHKMMLEMRYIPKTDNEKIVNKITGYLDCSETRQGRNWLPKFGLGSNAGIPIALPLKSFINKPVWVEQWPVIKKNYRHLSNYDKIVRY